MKEHHSESENEVQSTEHWT